MGILKRLSDISQNTDTTSIESISAFELRFNDWLISKRSRRKTMQDLCHNYYTDRGYFYIEYDDEDLSDMGLYNFTVDNGKVFTPWDAFKYKYRPSGKKAFKLLRNN
jgi:hypothetical protein